MIGTIRNIRDDKDYAFLVHNNNRDIFLHKCQFLGNWNELRELWRLGEVKLEFEVIETEKGIRAVKAILYDGRNEL